MDDDITRVSAVSVEQALKERADPIEREGMRCPVSLRRARVSTMRVLGLLKGSAESPDPLRSQEGSRPPRMKRGQRVPLAVLVSEQENRLT